MTTGATTPALFAGTLALSTVKSPSPRATTCRCLVSGANKAAASLPGPGASMAVRSQLAVVHPYSAVLAPASPLTCSHSGWPARPALMGPFWITDLHNHEYNKWWWFPAITFWADEWHSLRQLGWTSHFWPYLTTSTDAAPDLKKSVESSTSRTLGRIRFQAL